MNSLSFFLFLRLSMTEILLKDCKTASGPSMYPNIGYTVAVYDGKLCRVIVMHV